MALLVSKPDMNPANGRDPRTARIDAAAVLVGVILTTAEMVNGQEAALATSEHERATSRLRAT